MSSTALSLTSIVFLPHCPIHRFLSCTGAGAAKLRAGRVARRLVEDGAHTHPSPGAKITGDVAAAEATAVTDTSATATPAIAVIATMMIAIGAAAATSTAAATLTAVVTSIGTVIVIVIGGVTAVTAILSATARPGRCATAAQSARSARRARPPPPPSMFSKTKKRYAQPPNNKAARLWSGALSSVRLHVVSSPVVCFPSQETQKGEEEAQEGETQEEGQAPGA